MNIFTNLIFKKKRRVVNLNKAFTFSSGSNIANPNSWGDWLLNQPAPVAKVGHKLDRLTTFIWDQRQEYNISLDLCNRWGYALNVGYGNDYLNVIADAKTSNPNTVSGKLLKLAVNEPAKYPVAIATTQLWYSDEAAGWESKILKDAYLQDANGNVVGAWSPEATPAALATSIAYKCDVLHKMNALGINITNVYDGGERGLKPTYENPDQTYGKDPKVVAAKGTEDWVNYISRKKGEQEALLYAGVKAALPNRVTYVGYGYTAESAYDVPGARNYGFNDYEVMGSCDVPSSVAYFRDFAVPAAGMGNPLIKDRAYVDVLTYQVRSITRNILVFNKPISYNWLSAGSFRDPTDFYMFPISAYKGFLKCMYALGQKGAVAGYFTQDISLGSVQYTPYVANQPPHWLLQQLALGEVHARFTWFDDYILLGDLVMGTNNSFELTANKKVGDFFATIPTTRAFARKKRGVDEWLVVLWSAEDGTSTTPPTTGIDKLVWVRDIPSLPPIEFTAGGEGSIYTVVKTGGSLVVTKMD